MRLGLIGFSTAQALTFSDISAGFDPVHHCTATWIDFDNDGDLDVFLHGQTLNLTYITRLYRDDGGSSAPPWSPGAGESWRPDWYRRSRGLLRGRRLFFRIQIPQFEGQPEDKDSHNQR